MKIITLWACTSNTDTMEGRGQTYDVCYAETRTNALAIVTSPAFYGKYGVGGARPFKGGEYDVVRKTFLVVENATEIPELLMYQKREAALAKLTEADKEALGLNKPSTSPGTSV